MLRQCVLLPVDRTRSVGDDTPLVPPVDLGDPDSSVADEGDRSPAWTPLRRSAHCPETSPAAAIGAVVGEVAVKGVFVA